MATNMVHMTVSCVGASILFLGFIITNRSIERKLANIFTILSLIFLFIVLLDNVEYIENQRNSPSTLLYIATMLNYVVRPIAAYLMILIFRIRMKIKNTSDDLVLTVPLFLNIILCVASIFNGWVFYYSPDNTFYYGPLAALPFLVGGFYGLMMILYPFAYAKWKFTSEAFILTIIALFSTVTTLMEVIGNYYGVFNIACSIGLVYYYLFIHTTLYSRDELTNCYNRRSFYLDVKSIRKNPAIIVQIDLNDLKRINDSQGHAFGDRALITLSTIFQQNCRKGQTLYRVGGDEFLLICKNNSLETVNKLISKVHKDMLNTPYTFAYGTAEYKAGDNIDAILSIADRNMYKMKAAMKNNAALAKGILNDKVTIETYEAAGTNS